VLLTAGRCTPRCALSTRPRPTGPHAAAPALGSCTKLCPCRVLGGSSPVVALRRHSMMVWGPSGAGWRGEAASRAHGTSGRGGGMGW
jgi:hypothetical protein